MEASLSILITKKKSKGLSPFHDQDMLRASIWNDCIYRLCQFNEIQGVEEEIVFFFQEFSLFGQHWSPSVAIWNRGERISFEIRERLFEIFEQLFQTILLHLN